jgi:hypothetical protein
MAIGTGIALLLLLEMEKLIRHALRGKGAA